MRFELRVLSYELWFALRAGLVRKIQSTESLNSGPATHNFELLKGSTIVDSLALWKMHWGRSQKTMPEDQTLRHLDGILSSEFKVVSDPFWFALRAGLINKMIEYHNSKLRTRNFELL